MNNVKKINEVVANKVNNYFDKNFKKDDYIEEYSLYYIRKNMNDWLLKEGLK